MFFNPKKIFNLILMCTTVLTLTACENNLDKAKEQQVSKVTIPEDKFFKGIKLQYFETETFIEMGKALRAELAKKGYKDKNIQIDYKCAEGDANELVRLAEEFAHSDYDFIIPVGTPTTQAVVNTNTSIPIIYMGVSDPRMAGVSAKPDADTTGTIMPISITPILQLARKLTPKMETIGLIHYSRESNATDTLIKVKRAINAKGLRHREEIIDFNQHNVEETVNKLLPYVDALFIANESLIQADMPVISKLALEANIPIYCAFDPNNYEGCLASDAISPENVGTITANLLVEYLGGTKIEDIAAKQLSFTSAPYINKTVAKQMNIDIPKDLVGVIYID